MADATVVLPSLDPVAIKAEHATCLDSEVIAALCDALTDRDTTLTRLERELGDAREAVARMQAALDECVRHHIDPRESEEGQ